MQLPDMDGFELVKELKNQAAGKDLQVILLTAFDRRGLGDSALNAGFSAFLTKPVKQSQLLDTISNLIGKPTLEKKPINVEPFKSSLPKVSKEADSRKVNILLAEDNPANQKLALVQIQKLGYLVDAVDNGKKAVEIVISDPHRYAMVLMDCQMPEMDGFEATRRIRKSEKSTKTHIPIIAMTANAMEGDRKACEKAGMDDYISKPVTLKILAEILERWSPSQGKTFTKKDSKGKRKMKITLDTNILNNIRELQSEGEEDLLSELIDVYKKDSKQTITKIHTSSEQGDLVLVRRAAHSLKGSSANLGAAELAAICHKLETAAGEGDSARITNLLPELNETYNQSVKELVKLKKPK
jgi:CheY-like chemotaxis protein/HPt (histidine-containing phosphotransfer) domain-containing protein